MIVNPRLGMPVQIWYKKALASYFPLHGKVGRVVIVGRYRKAPKVGVAVEGCRQRGPRNHGVEVDGIVYVVPCGNIRPIKGKYENQ